MGSPRKEGNTDILIDKIINGAQAARHHTEKLILYDLTLLPCIDCRNCSSGDRVCTRDDDMQDIYPKIEGADVILFGTPLYWYGPTGPMKLLMDRLLPYSETDRLKGKRGYCRYVAANSLRERRDCRECRGTGAGLWDRGCPVAIDDHSA